MDQGGVTPLFDSIVWGEDSTSASGQFGKYEGHQIWTELYFHEFHSFSFHATLVTLSNKLLTDAVKHKVSCKQAFHLQFKSTVSLHVYNKYE